MGEPDPSTHQRRSSSMAQSLYANRTKRRSSIGMDPIPQTRSEVSGSTSDIDMQELDAWDGTYEDDEDDEETGLTTSHRKERRRRRRRKSNGDSDSNLPIDSESFTRRAIREAIINGLLIALWYSFSISISVYNKWMFSKENLDFHFPLFTTSIHMLVQFALASAVLYFIPAFRPREAVPPKPGSLDNDDDNEHRPPPDQRPLMTRTFYLTRIAPCGTATALDIGLGNFSLRFITLTFYTMCKSSVLAFVLLFAFLFRLETPTWRLCAIIAVMTAGVIMMVAGETAFSAAGFALVMSASCCSGFRWSLTQILLLRNRATGNPFSSIFFLTPVMFGALFLLALPIEGPVPVFQGLTILVQQKGVWFSTVLMLFPGFLAFLMVAAEFALLKRTSVVTLSVCGIFKEVLTISAAAVVFGDELSPINLSGLSVTILSIAAYNWLKYSTMAKEARLERRDGELMTAEGQGEGHAENVPLRPDGRSDGEDDEGYDSDDAADGFAPNGSHISMNGHTRKQSTNGFANGHAPGPPGKRAKDLE